MSQKGLKSVSVKALTTGMTKVSKEIVLDKHVKLIDSPGVVFASSLGEVWCRLNPGLTSLGFCA